MACLQVTLVERCTCYDTYKCHGNHEVIETHNDTLFFDSCRGCFECLGREVSEGTMVEVVYECQKDLQQVYIISGPFGS